jgi:MOSC domain-containing protein YiiM
VSGIYKHSVDQPIALHAEGVHGDEVADLVHHGGPDKAVCVYSLAHYPHWEQVLGRKMAYGAFGENFTVGGLLEEDVCIGDTFRAGSALVQISQPRIPCWKLAMKWGLESLPRLAATSGKTGFYFRVLEPGTAQAGDRLIRVKRHPAGVTVAEANRVMHRDKQDLAGIRSLLDLRDVLAASWIEMLTKRLAKLNSAGGGGVVV